MRNCLIVIPVTKPSYSLGFSAPMSWIFSDFKISSSYSFLLSDELIKNYEYFIIELNWITEFYEVTKIIEYIKKINKNNKILIGGLFSTIHYKNLIKYFDIDYFIKGYNEKPMKQFLAGEKISKIENIVTKNFENDTSYILDLNEWNNIKIDLSWNNIYCDFLSNIENLQNFKYYEYIKQDEDLKGFILPMIITSRGKCFSIHEGCEYCLGKREIYSPIYLKNEVLHNIIKNILYNNITLYFTTPIELYNFKNIYYDKNAFIEIDSFIKDYDKLKDMLYSFKQVACNIPISRNGIMGNKVYSYEELKLISSIQDDKHKIKFIAYDDIYNNEEENYKNNISIHKVLHVFNPEYANYNSYIDINIAYQNSKFIFDRNLKDSDKLIPYQQTLYKKKLENIWS